VHDAHGAASAAAGDAEARVQRLCELNVVEQARHVCQTSIVRDAWRRGQPLSVHGWIYDLRDGLLRDLECTTTGAD
jgi:carbonic anhydrase